MRRSGPRTRTSTAKEQVLSDGRIPFRIRIGVTGHQELDLDPSVQQVIRGQIHRVRGPWPRTESEVRLAIVSHLAEGADRLLVRIVQAEARKQDEGARMEVILP